MSEPDAQGCESESSAWNLLQEIALDGIVVHRVITPETPGYFIYANPAICQLLDYTLKELRHLTPQDIQAPEEVPRVADEQERLLHDGALLFEKTLVTKGGRRIPSEIRTKMFERRGRQYGVVGHSRRERTQASGRAVARARTVISHLVRRVLRFGIGQVTPRTGQFVLVNDRLCQITGYERDELLNQAFVNILHPDDRQTEYENFCQNVTGGTDTFSTEKRFLRKDGSIAWAEISGRIVRDREKNPEMAIACAIDVTERHDAQIRLHDSEQRFRILAEMVPGILFTTTPDGLTDYLNSRFSFFTGMAEEQSLGNGWMQALHPDDRPKMQEVWDQCVASGKRFEMEHRLRRRDGAYRWFDRPRSGDPQFRRPDRPLDRHLRGRARFENGQGEVLRELNETLEARVEQRTTKVQQLADQLRALTAELTGVEQRERRQPGRDPA